jgi:2-keto-4-pentenoate hydratase/2-oxohepta-3-ene-1,7-dioic acid hydratase in catechol pathway
MKIVRFFAGGLPKYGILDNQVIHLFQGNPFGSIKTLDKHYELSDVRLLAPCRPSKIVALGINYRSHAVEFKHDLPKDPLIFLKPATTVIGPEEAIVYPAMSHQVDYECELGIVIKQKARLISQDKVADFILGYTCFNDVTARDLQKIDGQWTRAKGFDTFAAIGPWIETELDPSCLTVETYLNGELKQQGTTADLIFSVPRVVSFVSQVMTLLPGDVIATGTPSGVGPMQPGDTVEIRIQSIGTLRNYVVRL